MIDLGAARAALLIGQMPGIPHKRDHEAVLNIRQTRLVSAQPRDGPDSARREHEPVGIVTRAAA